MTKVLITAGALDMGGLENQLVYVGKNIDRNRFEIDYACTNENAFYKKDIVKSGCGFIIIPDPRKDGIIKYMVAMLRLLVSGKYDVIHAQELFHSGIEVFLAWLARVPIRIAHSHSTSDGSDRNLWVKSFYHGIMRIMILLFATDYLACSTPAGRFLYGKNILKSKKFKVVFNSVEVNKYFGEYTPKTLLNKERKHIIHVGRFVDVKNHFFMIELAEQIKKRNLPYTFVFIGTGELFELCASKVQELGLKEQVVFLGQREDVADLIRQGDMFILPSFYEGMPLSLIEAQAAGLPCLVADHITKEVDFEIGLMNYLSLSSGVSGWMDKICSVIDSPHPNENSILSAIHKKGFDVLDFQRILCDIYEGKKV